MKEIRKKFKLVDFLRDLKIGEECKIYNRAYKPSVVRSTVNKLNAASEGLYEMTEKGLIDSCTVIRLK